jgi:hypothetical protein
MDQNPINAREVRMQRLRLIRAVSIEGRTVWGRKCLLVLEPHGKDDHWRWGNAGDTPITPELFGLRTSGRNVALVKDKCVLKEFEHIGFLHALGLRGVRVWLHGSTRPPYMCSQALWGEVFRSIEYEGGLQPWAPAPSDWTSSSGPVDRRITYKADSDGLVLRAVVNYGHGPTGNFELEIKTKGPLPEADIARAIAAPTLARPSALGPLVWAAQKLGWLHAERLAWMPQDPTEEFLTELARHKVVDGSLVSFAAPLGAYLCGTVVFLRANHGLDLQFINKIAGTKITSLSRVA